MQIQSLPMTTKSSCPVIVLVEAIRRSSIVGTVSNFPVHVHLMVITIMASIFLTTLSYRSATFQTEPFQFGLTRRNIFTNYGQSARRVL